MSQDVSKLTMIKENFDDTFIKTAQQKQEQLIHSFQQQPYHGTEFDESMSQQRKSAEEKSHSVTREVVLSKSNNTNKPTSTAENLS